MWPFKPKWENINRKKRLSGLYKLNKLKHKPKYRAILENIAQKDEIYEVRQLAYYFLGMAKTQVALADTAIHAHYNESAKAITELTDQMHLTKVAKKAFNNKTRILAIEKLTDQSILGSFVNNNEDDIEVRTAAAKQLTEQNILNDIIQKNSSYLIRKIAYKKLGIEESQESLIDIIKNEKDESLCKAAVEKLTDQNLLFDLAKNDSKITVRHAAIKCGKFGSIEIIENLLKEIFNSINFSALEVLKYLHHNANLSDEAKLKILSFEGKEIQNHYDYPQVCSLPHEDKPAKYFNL